jgi:putative cell wall-binding protein
MRRAFATLALLCLVVIGLVPAASASAATARFGGVDRFEVAIGVSQQFAPGVPVVYVAKASDYPDALSAAPAAALQGGPLLLTLTDSVPANVQAELQRLQPQRIVVVGGEASVSAGVFAQLTVLAPSISRIAGADRYEASRNLIASTYSDAPLSRVYVATGANFPDALSAGAAAGSLGVPVLLVNGRVDTIDAATRDLLTSLAPDQIVIAGGPASIPPGIESDLQSLGSPNGVLRLSGADRYEAALAVSAEAFPGASSAFIATGGNFPDALTGAALAGREHSPLLLVTPGCAPQAVADYVASSGIADITAFGGPRSVSDTALDMVSCNDYRTPSGTISYDCGGGVQFYAYNPNVTTEVVTARIDVNNDGVLDRDIESVTLAPGESYAEYNGGALPDGVTASVVLQARGETFASQLITPHCVTSLPTATASYSCTAGLQYAVQNPNRAAVTVTVSTDDDGDGVLDRLLQTVQLAGEKSYENYSAGSLPSNRTTNIVFQLNGQTFASQLLTPGCVAAPPSGVQQWANARYGWFPAESKSGNGDGFYNLPAGSRAGAVTVQSQGRSNIVVWAIDKDGVGQELLVNEVGPYAGTVGWNLSGSFPIVKLKITASGPWTISFTPVSSLPGIQSSSAGDAVFLYDGGPASLNLYYPGTRSFSVREIWDADVIGLHWTKTLVDTVGFYSNSVPLRAGYSIIAATADGPWAASVG